nr:TadE/TadG family type IV pilus assembly protein [uncultured Rhodopila sp.]
MSGLARLGRLAHDRRGVAAIEFALVSLAYFPLCFGIIEIGLMLWTQDVLQTTALMTARCVAVAAPACKTNPAQYAVNTASDWLSSGMLIVSGVSIKTNAVCATAPGTAVVVTLTSTYFATDTLLFGISGGAISVVGCYPTSP